MATCLLTDFIFAQIICFSQDTGRSTGKASEKPYWLHGSFTQSSRDLVRCLCWWSRWICYVTKYDQKLVHILKGETCKYWDGLSWWSLSQEWTEFQVIRNWVILLENLNSVMQLIVDCFGFSKESSTRMRPSWFSYYYFFMFLFLFKKKIFLPELFIFKLYYYCYRWFS